MPYNIQKNVKGGVVTLHCVANSGNIIVTGNNSVSNVASEGEDVVSAPINQIWAGSPSGNAAYWEIRRDGTIVAVIDSTCYLDFTGNGNQFTQGATAANLAINLIGATAGFLVVELQKLGAGGRNALANSEYFRVG